MDNRGAKSPRAFDWNDLKYFLAVARHGSTLAAARVLRLSQSTVHRRLDELEQQLGHALVRRSSGGYRLTELGEELLDYAERVETAVADFDRRVSAWGQNLNGTVIVTCPEALGSRLMQSPLMEKFNARYPALRVEFVMSGKVLDLGRGEADVAIRASAPTDDALVGRRIGDGDWAVYAGRSYVERRGRATRPADMDQHAIVLFDGEMHDHPAARWLRSIAPNAKIAARADSLLTLLLAVKSGAGLAPMPVIVGEEEAELERVFGPVAEIATPFYLVMHRDMQRTPRVRAFFDFIIDELPAVRPLLDGKASRRKNRL